jgi:hypothetical protein
VKKVLILMVALIAPAMAQAELSSGPERNACFKQNEDIPTAYNCLPKETTAIKRWMR